MFTRNIKDTFTANLLNAVSGVLGEANKKKCSEGCECEACTPEETKEGYVSHAQRKAVWANRADDGKGHPDKKMKKEEAEVEEGYMPTNDMPSASDRKTAGKLGALLKRERDSKEKKEPNGVKTEDTDMPWAEDPNNPTRKVGERKDEYGNKVKNVAKHIAKKAMKANEEVEDLDEKRGLWDNIHAKRKRIKAGSGERMRKPGSEGAPTAADLKASQKEEVSLDGAFEQIDEISKATMGRYINKAKDSIDTASYRQGHKEAHGSSSKPLEKKLTKRHKGIETAVKKLTKEAAHDVDHMPGQTISSSAADKQMKDVHDNWAAGAAARAKGRAEAAKRKLTKEESEQIDELSKATMGRYINKAATKMGSQGVTAGLKIAADEKSSKNFKDMGKREKGIKLAVSKLTKEDQDFIDSLNNEMFEEIALDEARGRPRKAGAKDFTIHPRTKEKLMHDNPAHMKKIELLQKNRILDKPKIEAGQNIMTQLQKAKTSMTGGTKINFTHGDSKEVSGTHAARLLDKHAGMKPAEKEAFQKKIGHSHANLKSEL